jgi:hypothetical protein
MEREASNTNTPPDHFRTPHRAASAAAASPVAAAIEKGRATAVAHGDERMTEASVEAVSGYAGRAEMWVSASPNRPAALMAYT